MARNWRAEPEGGGDLAPPTYTLDSMAHEQGSSQNSEELTLATAEDAGVTGDDSGEESAASPPGRNGVDELESGEKDSAPKGLVEMPVDVDDETAELLRTLEMPSVSLTSREPGAEVPLAGVLRRRPRRPRLSASGTAQLDEATVQDTDATVPDVIAYEPIRVEAPWSSSQHTPMEIPARRDATVQHNDVQPTVPELDLATEYGEMGEDGSSLTSLDEPAPDASLELEDEPEAQDTLAAEAPQPADAEELPSIDIEIVHEGEDVDSDARAAHEARSGASAPQTDDEDDDAELDAEELDELEVEELDSGDEPAVQQAPAPAPATTSAQGEAAARRQAPPRPPKPPPRPAPRLKEGELILTQDALDEMLPGGRADEARDLADETTPESEWHREIFTEDFFRTLPRNFHKQTVREAEFVIDRLGVEPGARLLDLCCGFGRHTMELARRGFEVVGLDLAMPLLQKALNEAQRRSLSIKFVHGDMRELNFQGVFDGIFNVQTSFGYFTDKTNFKVLQGIRRALKPGGRFFVETINRDFVCEEIPMRVWWEGTECLILEEVDFDYSTSVLKVKRSFVFEDSAREPWEQNIHVRLYSAHELQNLLRRAGFEIIELSGDYNFPGRFFGNTSRRVVVVAERPVD